MVDSCICSPSQVSSYQINDLSRLDGDEGRHRRDLARPKVSVVAIGYIVYLLFSGNWLLAVYIDPKELDLRKLGGQFGIDRGNSLY